MPTYEYRCLHCGHKLEAFQKITDEPLKECPQCNKPSLSRGPGGGIGLSFVGTGWYKTDYNSPTSSTETKEVKSNPGPCCPCGNSKGSCSKPTE